MNIASLNCIPRLCLLISYNEWYEFSDRANFWDGKKTALFWAITRRVVVIPYRRFGTN